MIAFMCAAMVAVESFLYSLLQSMGLIGGSYADITNAFPNNSLEQNQVLYSIANNPAQSSGGFAPSFASDVNLYSFPAPGSSYNPGSDWAKANWNAIMSTLGFAVVDNNVDVAVSNGYNPSPSASQWVGTLKALTGDEIVVSLYGNTNTFFRYVGDTLPDNIPIQLGMPTIPGQVGNIAVWRWSYNDQVVYSTSLGSGTQPYEFVNYDLKGQFEIVNNTLQWRTYRTSNGSLYKSATFTKQNWINQGIAIDDAITFEPSENVVLGENYLSFGDSDNPVIGVSYDPSTGVTSYKYKDGTISTTPPAVLGDSVALSPSITQPLTNYIINEGDITNIYNPDASIPSDSTIPFDFISLGDLLYKEFTPVATFDFKPPYNRFINKYDWETPFKKICQKFNITGRRPSHIISFVWLNKSFSFDIWGWCEYLLDNRGYALYMKFMRFFLYFGMVSGCLLLFLRSINVKLGTVIISKG